MTQQEINSTSMLRIGTILRGTYRIDSYLSSGGFGNTYIATNIEFDECYAVKEFFMKGVTQRDDNQITVSVSNSENTNSFLEQREKFKKEARRLRQFDNQHIIRVHDMFDENGTSYYVMDYVDGENLSDRLKRTGCPMKESEVNLIFPQILDALKTVHDASMWHLDLKPANIMLGKDGKIKIIDFGASKQLNVQKGGATTSTAISYTNGYAPREQMEQNYDKFGPWTDLYALGATIYNLLSNKRPPLPTDIDDDMTEDKHLALPLPSTVSNSMKQLVLWLMQTNRMKRPQSIGELTEKLSSLCDNTQDKETSHIEEETIIATPKAETSEETVIEMAKNISYESKQADTSIKEIASTEETIDLNEQSEDLEFSFSKLSLSFIGVYVSSLLATIIYMDLSIFMPLIIYYIFLGGSCLFAIYSLFIFNKEVGKYNTINNKIQHSGIRFIYIITTIIILNLCWLRFDYWHCLYLLIPIGMIQLLIWEKIGIFTEIIGVITFLLIETYDFIEFCMYFLLIIQIILLSNSYNYTNSWNQLEFGYSFKKYKKLYLYLIAVIIITCISKIALDYYFINYYDY